jgi:hypothetical protein
MTKQQPKDRKFLSMAEKRRFEASSLNRTERERELEKIVVDTMWMARRYACGRLTLLPRKNNLDTQTNAPQIVNQCLEKLDKLGIVITDDSTLMEKGNSNGRKLDVS